MASTRGGKPRGTDNATLGLCFDGEGQRAVAEGERRLARMGRWSHHLLIPGMRTREQAARPA